MLVTDLLRSAAIYDSLRERVQKKTTTYELGCICVRIAFTAKLAASAAFSKRSSIFDVSRKRLIRRKGVTPLLFPVWRERREEQSGELREVDVAFCHRIRLEPATCGWRIPNYSGFCRFSTDPIFRYK